MDLTGQNWIGGRLSQENQSTFTAFNPADGLPLDTEFHEASIEEVNQAVELAQSSFDPFRNSSVEQRAGFLDKLADEVEALGDALLDRAHLETGLPMARLNGERARATGQARLFGELIREGSWVDARIDLPIPDRKPLPKPDVRRMFQPIGPIAVFGASNFPLAISVIGTDTVSAMGAGCPVIVKGHPAHPGTCELLAGAITRALKASDLPLGAFSLLQGVSHETGLALVRHPALRAVAFTGSLQGGRALCDAAAARPEPIPVYAEMGSINPVFILPGALKSRGEAIAQGYIQSVTLGTGQFCTNPGLLLGLGGLEFDKFRSEVSRLASDVSSALMLHKGIADRFNEGVQRFAKLEGITEIFNPERDKHSKSASASCHIFSTDVATYLDSPDLHEENFGPSSIMIEGQTMEELVSVAESLSPQLTATIHGTEEDLLAHQRLIQILERKAGRIIFNGFPTGIEVCPSMHHGGFYPAASHPHFTSIGTASIFRFVRPVCYQGFPQTALPDELKDRNVRGIWRLVDNQFTRDDAR